MFMDWESPLILLLILPALAFLLWAERRSAHPMPAGRKRVLLVVRALGVMLALVALAGPAEVVLSTQRAVVLAVDCSQSLGEEGVKSAMEKARGVLADLPGEVDVSVVGFGAEARLLSVEDLKAEDGGKLQELMKLGGAQSQYAEALEFARAMFPAGTSRHVVMIGDGHETRGSLLDSSREASWGEVQVHAVPVAGVRRPDVRLRSLTPNQSRLHEGAALALTVEVESALDGAGLLKLFENGVEVERRSVAVKTGQVLKEVFTRHPNTRNIYKYRAVLEGFAEDTMTANNEALAIVDVRGRLRLLYVEGDPSEGQFLMQAMEKEGIQLELRGVESMPTSPQDLSGYDGVILSDVPAHRLGEGAMVAIRDYVDKLGGGFLMLGGPNSFGVGGYYRTPIEDVLPVRLKSPDEEEKQSSALALVIDRSGSMAGEKLEMAKNAAIATAEVLTRNDSIGVFAFDSEVHVVVPMTRLTSTTAVAGQIAGLTSGGGTNLLPGMIEARNQLQRVKAKIKHMIILSDGQTSGQGYEALASQCRAEGTTISTVSIGEGAHVGLMQAVASLGGGQSYTTLDASNITRIFTQDTLIHTGRMIREDALEPQMVERHAMLAGFEKFEPPPLLGYVKTLRKSTAQVPLVTDTGEPLLAHWRYGLGKATAFTSDAKSRWASLWISRWSGFGQFWSQVLRETARPPQGQGMDLRTENRGNVTRVSVDVLQDAGTRGNEAEVTAEVFHVPADSLGASMDPVKTLSLRQSGPGLYEGDFEPEESGVYLVRAQSGAQMVTAGLVFNPSSEASLGTVNDKLLREAARLTGGSYLDGDLKLELGEAKARRYVELWPYLVMAMLALFLVDVAVRRWEHVTGVAEIIVGWFWGKRKA
ncbi:VWA domain-containing protein [Phragmitibacter flavus]|uniref:VWA domain-containing protein n=1 Tax=Phragmitibacter flavus TaxID=2576071 RepID=A0A5R8KEN4_9BACT|nr:VWA domain-containing protein [Phragmitibacter flavus]TLD70750.1 VWA domain-containing protein [Phragmitibacter flavus]